jgi:hypothetical protein
MTNGTFTVIGLLFSIAFVLLAFPFSLILALNLLGLAVPLTWKTLLGAFIVVVIIRLQPYQKKAK